MGALRDRMHANMRMRNFSPQTINAYLRHVREFTRYFGKAPDLLGEEEVRRYLLYLSIKLSARRPAAREQTRI